jgi:hypothetical protein
MRSTVTYVAERMQPRTRNDERQVSQDITARKAFDPETNGLAVHKRTRGHEGPSISFQGMSGRVCLPAEVV